MSTQEATNTTIQAAAVLGISRNGHLVLPSGTIADEALALLAENDQEKYLLDAAAIVLLSNRAGFKPRAYDSLPISPAPGEVRPQCTETAGRLIQQVIDGVYRPAFGEIIRLMQRPQLRIPFLMIPAFLDFAAPFLDNHEDVAEIIGKRGCWLAGQRDHWKYVTLAANNGTLESQQNSLKLWSTTSRKERQTLLRKLRRNNPPAAIVLIESTWKQETASERLELLTELNNGLSSFDERFLENCLEDKSADIRRLAVSFLARIPGSAFLEEMAEYVKPLLTIRPKKFGGVELFVTLPSEFEPAWKRFGLEERSYIKDIGDRAWWFIQLIGIIPPEHWSTLSEQTADELIKCSHRTEWADALIIAFTKGSQNSRNTDWAYAILKYWSLANDARTTISSLLPSINERSSAVEHLLIELLDTIKAPLYDNHPALAYLRKYTHEWSVPLCRRVISSIKKRVLLPNSAQSPIYLTQLLLQDCAYYVSPTLADEFTEGWGVDSDSSHEWRKYVEKFCDIITFRSQVYKELIT